MLPLLFLWPLLGQACTLDDKSSYHLLDPQLLQRKNELTPEEATFLAVPSNASARASLKFITSKPHVAGTAGDLEMAEFVKSSFQREGVDAVLDPQKVLLTYPVSSALELLDDSGKMVAKASLAEDTLQSDPTTHTWWRNHTFNGYSPSGDVMAPVVYANYGLPEDFQALQAAGVGVNGSIVLMRYGKCFRGLKAMNAQKAGALAAIIYSDPEEDGYAKGSVYPYGPWRPKSSVQRGSIQFISLCAGDPTRAYAPHGEDVEALCGLSSKELIPQIPVLPISYGDALVFLESLGGKEAPENFRGALNITYRVGPTKDQYKVRVKVENRFQTSPVWNVIGKIPGTLPNDLDQPVVLGNHRDAWAYGAADPNSGTAQMIEVVRGLGKLLRTGWRPLRRCGICVFKNNSDSVFMSWLLEGRSLFVHLCLQGPFICAPGVGKSTVCWAPLHGVKCKITFYGGPWSISTLIPVSRGNTSKHLEHHHLHSCLQKFWVMSNIQSLESLFQMFGKANYTHLAQVPITPFSLITLAFLL